MAQEQARNEGTGRHCQTVYNIMTLHLQTRVSLGQCSRTVLLPKHDFCDHKMREISWLAE